MQGAAAFSGMVVVCPHPSKHLQHLQALPAFGYLNGKHLQCQRETGAVDTQSTSYSFSLRLASLTVTSSFTLTETKQHVHIHTIMKGQKNMAAFLKFELEANLKSRVKLKLSHYWISSHVNWSTQTNTAPLF